MAGEKTRVVKTPAVEPTITLTPADLQNIISESLKAALGQSAVPAQTKQEIQTNMGNSLTARINERVKNGERFFEHLADPNGPRRRIIIDQIYQEFVGKTITATVNGSSVKVPVDGRPHLVHPAHYQAIKAKLNYISRTRERANEGPDMFGNDIGDYQSVGNR